jgi:RNA polymerase sigma-70 factor (ECF subfamily)
VYTPARLSNQSGFFTSIFPRCRSPPFFLNFPQKIQEGHGEMFDNTNHYVLRTEESKGMTHYFVSFKDGQTIRRETEVSQAVYLTFCQFVKTERNLRRWDERHTEYSELTEETLNDRTRHTPKTVEETIVKMERSEILQNAIAELPDIQRRRFVLYYEYGMTYAAIGQLEGCSATSVKSSVDIAREKLLRKLEA